MCLMFHIVIHIIIHYHHHFCSLSSSCYWLHIEYTFVLFVGMQNVFSHQLPRMPKEYITRLVFDP